MIILDNKLFNGNVYVLLLNLINILIIKLHKKHIKIFFFYFACF